MDKERFMAYRDLRREVQQLQRVLEGMESRMFSPTGQRFTSTPHAASGKGNTMEDMVIRHLELKDTFNKKILELSQELIVLERAVESLESPVERELMRYRYFEGYSWYRISETMHYGESRLHELHGYALLKLRDYDPDKPVEEDYTPDIYKKPGEDGYDDCDGECDYCNEGCEQCDYCSTTEGCTVKSEEDF